MLRTTALKTKWEPVFISFFYKYVWVLIASKWAHRTQEERGTGCLVPLLPVFSVLPPQVMPHNIRQKQPTLGALYPRVGLICPGEFWCLHSNKDRLSFLLIKEHNEWGTGREWGRSVNLFQEFQECGNCSSDLLIWSSTHSHYQMLSFYTCMLLSIPCTSRESS